MPVRKQTAWKVGMGQDKIKPGDIVTLLGMPDWLIHDLPKDEQIELKSFAGRSFQVIKIDRFGYVWISADSTTDRLDGYAQYSGHEFCVSPDHLKKV